MPSSTFWSTWSVLNTLWTPPQKPWRTSSRPNLTWGRLLLSPFALSTLWWQRLPFLHYERRCILWRCVTVMPGLFYSIKVMDTVGIGDDLPLLFLFQCLFKLKNKSSKTILGHTCISTGDDKDFSKQIRDVLYIELAFGRETLVEKRRNDTHCLIIQDRPHL